MFFPSITQWIQQNNESKPNNTLPLTLGGARAIVPWSSSVKEERCVCMSLTHRMVAVWPNLLPPWHRWHRTSLSNASEGDGTGQLFGGEGYQNKWEAMRGLTVRHAKILIWKYPLPLPWLITDSVMPKSIKRHQTPCDWTTLSTRKYLRWEKQQAQALVTWEHYEHEMHAPSCLWVSSLWIVLSLDKAQCDFLVPHRSHAPAWRWALWWEKVWLRLQEDIRLITPHTHQLISLQYGKQV